MGKLNSHTTPIYMFDMSGFSPEDTNNNIKLPLTVMISIQMVRKILTQHQHKYFIW